MDDYENDFESEKEVNVSITKSPPKNTEGKGTVKTKNPSPRKLKENESKATISSKGANENRKSPYGRKSELAAKEEKSKSRNIHYINLSNQIDENK